MGGNRYVAEPSEAAPEQSNLHGPVADWPTPAHAEKSAWYCLYTAELTGHVGIGSGLCRSTEEANGTAQAVGIIWLTMWHW
jgi:hypothetical protein